MGSTISNITTSLTFLSLITLTSALAISLTLQKSKKMSAKEKVIADEPKLPKRFVVGSFESSRSQSLFTINLPPKDTSSPPKAMLFLMHGIAEHCCRDGYMCLYESLSEAGVDVYSFDYHGHGRSQGDPRGYAEKFDHLVDDVAEYIKLCQKKYTGKDGQVCPPLVLMGQSMGGLVTTMTALRLGSYNVGGVILTSPALGIDMNLELKIQKFFAPVINTFFSKAKIVDAVQTKDLSRNPKAVQAYVDDPLCIHGKLVARTAIEIDKTFDVAKERRGEVTCPILILHGTDDKVTSTKASEDFFRNVGTPLEKKRYLKLPGMYHELLEEPETDQILESIVEFAASGGKQFAEVEGEETDGVVSVQFK